jgi:hypothetical protein
MSMSRNACAMPGLFSGQIASFQLFMTRVDLSVRKFVPVKTSHREICSRALCRPGAILAGLALLGAAMATMAHAQLVHISATSDGLFAQLVGYPNDSHPMAGTASLTSITMQESSGRMAFSRSITQRRTIGSFRQPSMNPKRILIFHSPISGVFCFRLRQ